MEMKELLSFIDKIHLYFRTLDPSLDEEKYTLLRSVKLLEEIGELNEQILFHCGRNKKKDADGYLLKNTEHELADVIICTLMLAKAMDLNVEKALKEKIEIIKKKFSLE